MDFRTLQKSVETSGSLEDRKEDCSIIVTGVCMCFVLRKPKI